MALSANLFLRQSQSLVMTPQLMQSIQLLQMTHFELTQFIAQEVEKNPLLEFSSNDAELGSGNSREIEDDVRGVPDDGRNEDGADRGTGTELSSDWYESSSTGHAERLNDELDSNFANVFSDDAPPQRLDAPELVSQWKSMPGNTEPAERYDLDDFVAGQISLR
ncbi:MAG: RNA polymerase sigma-54 factor, partial [Rhizobium sp.]